jgi:hypothetical protein
MAIGCRTPTATPAGQASPLRSSTPEYPRRSASRGLSAGLHRHVSQSHPEVWHNICSLPRRTVRRPLPSVFEQTTRYVTMSANDAGHRYNPKFTQAVISATGPKASPRVRQITTSLIQHLHEFARENEITVDEWMAGLELVRVLPCIRFRSLKFMPDERGWAHVQRPPQRRPVGV